MAPRRSCRPGGGGGLDRPSPSNNLGAWTARSARPRSAIRAPYTYARTGPSRSLQYLFCTGTLKTSLLPPQPTGPGSRIRSDSVAPAPAWSNSGSSHPCRSAPSRDGPLRDCWPSPAHPGTTSVVAPGAAPGACQKLVCPSTVARLRVLVLGSHQFLQGPLETACALVS